MKNEDILWLVQNADTVKRVLNLLGTNSTPNMPKFEGNPLAAALGVEDIPVINGVSRGSLRDLVPAHFKNVGDEFQVIANSGNTIRSAFYFNGMAASVSPTKKITPRMKGPFTFNVRREDFDNEYTRAAKRKSA